MEPSFGQAMGVTLAVGVLVFATGATILLFAFRALRGEKPGKSHAVLIAILVTFVFACCAALLLLAYR